MSIFKTVSLVQVFSTVLAITRHVLIQVFRKTCHPKLKAGLGQAKRRQMQPGFILQKIAYSEKNIQLSNVCLIASLTLNLEKTLEDLVAMNITVIH